MWGQPRPQRQPQGLGAKRKRVRVRRAPGRGGGRAPSLDRGTPRGPSLPPGAPRGRRGLLPRSAAAPGPARPRGPGDWNPGVLWFPVLRAGVRRPRRGRERASVGASASARAVKGRAGFLGITGQTQGALFSSSPPSSPPREQEKEKSFGNALSPPPPPFFFCFHRLKRKIKYIPGTGTAAEQTQTRKCLKMF